MHSIGNVLWENDVTMNEFIHGLNGLMSILSTVI